METARVCVIQWHYFDRSTMRTGELGRIRWKRLPGQYLIIVVIKYVFTNFLKVIISRLESQNGPIKDSSKTPECVTEA